MIKINELLAMKEDELYKDLEALVYTILSRPIGIDLRYTLRELFLDGMKGLQ